MQIIYIPPKKSSSDEFLERNMRRELKRYRGVKTQVKIASCMIFIAIAQVNAYASEIEQWQAQVDKKGNEILKIIQIIGYWLSIIAAAVDIIKSFKKQDVAGLFGIAFKYAMLFGILKALPRFFSFVGEIFEL